MITITRKGLQLAINDEIIPAQGSSDVPVQFINDEETYQNYLIEPRVGWYKNGCYKSTVARYEGGIIYLPAEVFIKNGQIVIVIALIDPDDGNHIEVTHPVNPMIINAPLGDVILPEKVTWEQAVTTLVKQLNEQIQADVAAAIKKANKASEDATAALTKANKTNQTINEKIEDGSFIPNFQIGEVTTGEAGTDAKVSIDGTKLNPILNMTIPRGKQGVQGPQGEVGPQGERGPQGEKGEPGDLKCPYDIGDLYITLNETMPSVKWEGTSWERVEGLVPVGYKASDADFGTLGKTGGSKAVTLTKEQLPEHDHDATTNNAGGHIHEVSGTTNSAGSHDHKLALKTKDGSGTSHTGAGINDGSWNGVLTHAWLDQSPIEHSGIHTHDVSGTATSAGSHNHTVTINNTGGSQAHNNLQPYKIFNMWVRIA